MSSATDTTGTRAALDLLLRRSGSWHTVQAILTEEDVEPATRIAIAQAAIRVLAERHGQVIALAHQTLHQLAPSGE